MRLLFAATCLIVIFFAAGGTTSRLPLVTTPNGDVQGTYSKSLGGLVYSQFLGIPYAQSPTGSLRFKEPQPMTKWSGVWHANLSTHCVQINHFPDPEGGALTGQEDCLYVNVFVPDEHPQQRRDLLDVVVHFHGGAFNFGYGNVYAGPKYLMDVGVILVTMNYRLGPLGFLSTGDDVVPGNNGMKDQVQALRWIRDNIKYFGGNPESVTLTGLSAGGASVHYHFLSPLSEGLFHRGISVSGTVLCPWTIQEAGPEKARQLGVSVGCSQTSHAQLVDCLRQRPAVQIVEAVRQFRPWLYNPFSPFGIVKEPAGTKAFLSEDPYEMLANGKVKDLPWLTSVTSEEGLYPAADYALKKNYLPDLERRWHELAPSVLDYNYTLPVEAHVSAADKAKEHYLKGKPIANETYKEIVQMIGDRHFVVPAYKAARLQAAANKSPVFFYRFSYLAEKVPTFTIYFANSDVKYGVSHGDDVMHLLSQPTRDAIELTPRDEAMKTMMLDMWKSFVSAGSPKVDNIEWTPVSKSISDDLVFLHIESPEKVRMTNENDLGHAEFWDSIPFRENQNLIAKA